MFRYKGSSQHFGPHVDEAVELGGGAATAYTLLIYLSGGLTGGETVFYGKQFPLLYFCPPIQALDCVLASHGKPASCSASCASYHRPAEWNC